MRCPDVHNGVKRVVVYDFAPSTFQNARLGIPGALKIKIDALGHSVVPNDTRCGKSILPLRAG